MKTIHEFNLNGAAAFEGLIAQSEYGSLAQAVASLTVFCHPDVVAETKGRAVFPIIRNAARRGEIIDLNGRLVGLDDNKSPTDAFLWANGIYPRPKDMQFNHIYARSDDPDCYTSLANLCASPAFIAKLTDTNIEIMDLLKYRVFDLYGWHPDDLECPLQPKNYSDLHWCIPLPHVGAVKDAIGKQLARRKDRTARMIKQTGWLFGT